MTKNREKLDSTINGLEEKKNLVGWNNTGDIVFFP